MEQKVIAVKLIINADEAIKTLREVEDILRRIGQTAQQMNVTINHSGNGYNIDKIIERINKALEEEIKPTIKTM